MLIHDSHACQCCFVCFMGGPSCTLSVCLPLQTALKTLMVIHRLMRESNISFIEEVSTSTASTNETLRTFEMIICISDSKGPRPAGGTYAVA